MTSVTEWLCVHAREQPDQVYLREAHGNRSITYGEMLSLVRCWQADLDERGPQAGRRIAIGVSDPLDFAVVFLAAVTGGRQAVPLDPDSPPAELERALRHVRPDLVVTDRPLPMPAGIRQISPRLTGKGAADVHRRTTAADPADEPRGGVLLVGSGAAGPFTEIFLAIDQLAHVAATISRHHQFSHTDIGYSPLPLVHVNTQVVGLLASLCGGATLVLDRRFRRRGFWTMIARHRMTWINAVPAMLALLARDPQTAQAHDCRVRFVRSAAAPLPVEVLRAFEAATGIPVLETYGTIETGGLITANPPHGTRKPGSVGVPVGSEVRVVDHSGTPCSPGVVGNIQVRGPGVIRAHTDSTGHDRFTHDGWLDTGDIGCLDSDGYLFLSGRTDDVINRGGEKVYPREVEEVLLSDPRVRHAAVVSRPDAVLGEVPVALVVPVDVPDTMLRYDLAERCETGLAKFKRPTSIEIVSDLPVRPTDMIRLERPAEPAIGHTHAAA
ncbi:class I adenylate-forming enzyme family protein [Frankia sp. Cj3]|uniref:class I adenylate-forming enzyme family protein n=1 Tax=Frankia sp. Cj3 TaxID=2880976 RepID=UPI001EF46D76|nr:AMP-binding protein [Frankia sp. Cj3]